MKNQHLLLLYAVFALVCSTTARAQVIVAQLPEREGPALSESYAVAVRPASGGEWQQVPVLRCQVNTRQVTEAAFAEFEMEGAAVVRVTRRTGEADRSKHTAVSKDCQVCIRPSSRQIASRQISRNTIELTLAKPEFLSIEFDGDRQHNLHLFANARHTAPSFEGLTGIDWRGEQSQDVYVRDARFIYFAPGVHRPKDLPSEEIKIPSNCTVYLAPGAIVKARLIVDHAENVSIVGRGIIDHPLRGVEITYSENVLVEGITFLNPAHYTIFGGESKHLTIRDIKSFSARSWTDGIDLMCCRDVTIEHCFLRTSDDCIALYNHRWGFWGGSEHIEVSGCTFWPDVAHPVNIGTHGDDRNPGGETLRHVRIHDCDIIGDDARGLGLLAINCGDNNHIRDVHFSQIRAEGLRRCRPFDLRIFQSAKYNRAPGCCIDSITFSDITIHPSVPDSCILPSRVEGLKDHPVGHYTLERVTHPAVMNK